MTFVRLMELRPNNWYINQAKLDSVREAWKNGKSEKLPPVLVTEIDDELSLIDGHSRAFAAFENGETHINAEFCKLKMIEGSTALYKHIHREGPKQGIETIADLGNRIVSPEEHNRLWIGYCNAWLKDNKTPSDDNRREKA